MPKVSKKLLKEIDLLSVYDDVLRENDCAWWLNNHPEEWGKREKELFDISIAIETRIKERVITILTA